LLEGWRPIRIQAVLVAIGLAEDLDAVAVSWRSELGSLLHLLVTRRTTTFWRGSMSSTR
jgi:hypothetical protein